MRVVLIGCGGVGCAVLELLPICRLLPASFASDLVVVEPRSIAHLPVLRPYRYRHVREALTPVNLRAVMAPLLARGGFVLDCSVNVDALAIMGLCHKAGCLYVNCSQEDWDTPDPGRIDPRPAALLRRSLCSRVWRARSLYGGRGPTMLADEGMNPGIVSLFALRGLRDMAAAVGDAAALAAMRQKRYALAAKRLGVRAIHVTERDTQALKAPRPRGLFCNTWSAVGLVAEALDPVQVGRGTHEPARPARATDVRNMRIIPARGMDCPAWSYSPGRRGRGGLFRGMLIPHGEANTLSHCLSGPGYRPSVYFVYQPAPFARASLAELRRGGYAPPPDDRTRVVPLPEIRSGYDAVGALIWSARHPPWWSGTVLDVRDVARLGLEFSGPTTVQVAIAILSAAKWMLAHPDRGFITPEDLPYDQILRDCEPYLGRVLSEAAPVPLAARPRLLRLADFAGPVPGRPRPRPRAAAAKKKARPRPRPRARARAATAAKKAHPRAAAAAKKKARPRATAAKKRPGAGRTTAGAGGR